MGEHICEVALFNVLDPGWVDDRVKAGTPILLVELYVARETTSPCVMIRGGI